MCGSSAGEQVLQAHCSDIPGFGYLCVACTCLDHPRDFLFLENVGQLLAADQDALMSYVCEDRGSVDHDAMCLRQRMLIMNVIMVADVVVVVMVMGTLVLVVVVLHGVVAGKL